MRLIARGRLLDQNIECMAHKVGTTGKSYLAENIRNDTFIAVEAHTFLGALKIAKEIFEEEDGYIIIYEWNCHYRIEPGELYSIIGTLIKGVRDDCDGLTKSD